MQEVKISSLERIFARFALFLAIFQMNLQKILHKILLSLDIIR